MSRLIDADALIESVCHTADLGGWIGDTLRNIKRLAVRYINSAPTIDAVEVVRCDNCKYRYMDADLQVWACTYGLMIKPNGFCNYGERKESE